MVVYLLCQKLILQSRQKEIGITKSKFELCKETLNVDLAELNSLLPYLLFYLNYRRIFLSLMETAGLTDLLKQEGSYTTFAPTDDAFEGLSQEDMTLLKSKR